MMKTRFLIIALTLVLSVSCTFDNPPYENLSGTRWIGTNYARGNLVDVTIGDGTAYLLYYSDERDWDERSGGIDTVGNLKYTLKGTWAPVSETSVQYGFSWVFHWTDSGNRKIYGSMLWDNYNMTVNLDGCSFPAYKVE